MSQAVEDVVIKDGNNYSRCEIWYLNEAGIQAASGNAFVITYTGDPPSGNFNEAQAAVTFQNVDQSIPIRDTASNTSQDQATLSTPAFAVDQGGMAVSGAAHGAGGSYDDNGWGSGWTEGTDQAPAGTMTTGTASTTNAYAADGTDTATATHSPSSNRHVIVAASLTPSGPSCLVTSTADSGAGSLRACITQANGTPGTRIRFNIPNTDPNYQTSGADSWWRISPASALPSITAAGTKIDGTTQTTNQGDTNTKGPEIELEGSSAGTSINGLTITGGNCTIRHLVINRFNDTGIYLDVNDGNKIEGNYIGTDVTGSVDQGNTVYGIHSYWNSGSNTIGGTTPAQRNVISGNDMHGIFVQWSQSNVISGNYIGTNAAGDAPLENGWYGIRINVIDNNTIGGTAAGSGNLISGNNLYGIFLDNCTFTTIQGNYIGTDATGTSDVGNSSGGIYISAGTDNMVGGAVPEARNIISGNNGTGIYLSGANTAKIIGNYIGTDVTGVLPIGNFRGIALYSDTNQTTIGGMGSGENNIIAFNNGVGIYLTGAGTDNNQISGNAIFSNTSLGIDIDPIGVGTGSGANDDKAAPTISSITPSGSDFTVVAAAGSGDVIDFFRVNNAAAPAVSPDGSGSGEGYLFLGWCVDNGACDGPHISAVADADPTAGVVQGTLLSSGLAVGDIVSATAADSNRNTSEFASNVVVSADCTVTNTADSGAGSLRDCINYANSNAGSTIGFNIPLPANQSSGGDSWWRISPTSALPNITAAGTIIDGTTQTTNQGDTNSRGPEIEIYGAGAGGTTDGLVITGGSCTVRGLVVNRFTRHGIVAQTSGGNTITGNYIGTDATGTADLGNGGDGVVFAIDNNTIGGLALADRNVISGNDSSGIRFITAPTNNNFILGNYIGTNATGTAAIGNTSHGINIVSAPSNTIGGAAIGAGNLISGNGGDGISISDPSSSGNIVQGNLIGTDAGGTLPVPNTGTAGIHFWMGADDNMIGGTSASEGNVIAFNDGDGVYLADANADNNRIIGNSIFSNTGLGIDIAPDGLGTGSGANNDKPAPTITSVTPNGSDFTAVVTVTSGDLVEFFRVNNPAAPVVNPDGSGSGEGYLFLGRCVDNGGNCFGPHIDTTVADANAAAGTVELRGGYPECHSRR
jgi:hypothetical protein